MWRLSKVLVIQAFVGGGENVLVQLISCCFCSSKTTGKKMQPKIYGHIKIGQTGLKHDLSDCSEIERSCRLYKVTSGYRVLLHKLFFTCYYACDVGHNELIIEMIVN